ncbi:MAG: hypothetical protein ABIF82_02435 [Planctomycetota bacterium]
MRTFAILCLVLLAASCDDPAGTQVTRRSPASGSASDAAPKKPGSVTVDHSQTTAEAVENGAPAATRPWLPTDYVKFDAYLAKMPRGSYPRFGSGKSGDLFKRVIESANQTILTNRDIHVNSRMPMCLQMQSAVSNALKRYARAHVSGTDYSTELVYLQGISLAMSREMLKLVDEFLLTVDPNDGKHETRMAGHRQAKSGVAMQLDGCLQSLQETHTYSSEERQVLCRYLLENGPTILRYLEQIVQREFQIKVGKVAKAERDKAVRGLLEQFLSAISGSGPAKTPTGGQE